MVISLEIEENLVKLASQVSGLPTGKEAVEAVLCLLTSHSTQLWSDGQPQILPMAFHDKSKKLSTSEELTTVTTLTDWSHEPFIGMWKNRQEMKVRQESKAKLCQVTDKTSL